jgi:hypothetical protein
MNKAPENDVSGAFDVPEAGEDVPASLYLQRKGEVIWGM